MSYIPTVEQAKEILMQFNKEPFHISHGEIVSGVLGEIAKKHDPENVEYWKVVGMLHDIDYELYPDQHCIKSQEMMRELDIDEGIIRSTASHCFGLHEGCDIEPIHIMEKYLFATDELTGLIGAAARPYNSWFHNQIHWATFYLFFIFKYLFVCLAALGLSSSMWDL